MNLVAPSGVGLNTPPLPCFPARTWRYSWRRRLTQLQWVFPLVWQLLTTGVPRSLTRAFYYCARGSNNLSTGLLSYATFNLTCITVCLPVHQFRNSLRPISCSNTYIPHTEHDKIPNKINYPYVLFLGSPLFIYLSIRRLLLVAHCQLSSSTMGILLALHLSCQHITAYLY